MAPSSPDKAYDDEEHYSVAYRYRPKGEPFYTPKEQEQSYRFNQLTRRRSYQSVPPPPTYVDLLTTRLKNMILADCTPPLNSESDSCEEAHSAEDSATVIIRRQNAATQILAQAESKELDSLINGMMVKLFDNMTLASVKLPGYPEDEATNKQDPAYVYTRSTYWALEILWGVVSLYYVMWFIHDYFTERYFGLGPPFPMWLYVLVHTLLLFGLRKLCVFVVKFCADLTAMTPDRRAWSRRRY
ncbi:hypothetical protein K490DRAFT_56922 [Saccharata proteae CBS 121410]|uniref:Uncharacterized protein n=1 Tax=Saccharata proteae CBS 121410 TaxID=1314787 RepID=A0A9P4LVA5_9PEZI|nr:hypothetical protein K490DRAFT_56922 [Saccharata proteae CBS 121410]